jgi:hypothetical protein
MKRYCFFVLLGLFLLLVGLRIVNKDSDNVDFLESRAPVWCWAVYNTNAACEVYTWSGGCLNTIPPLVGDGFESLASMARSISDKFKGDVIIGTHYPGSCYNSEGVRDLNLDEINELVEMGFLVQKEVVNKGDFVWEFRFWQKGKVLPREEKVSVPEKGSIL